MSNVVWKTTGGHFLGTTLFRSNFDNVVSHTATCFPWSNDTGTLWCITFTGLPQSVVDFNYHRQQLEELKKLPVTLIEAINKLLDQKQIGGGELMIDRLRKELIEPFEAKLNARLEKLTLTTEVKPSGTPGNSSSAANERELLKAFGSSF